MNFPASYWEGDLEFAGSGKLYLAGSPAGGSSPLLVQINPANGSGTRIGETQEINGLAFTDGVLFGITQDVIFTLNPTTTTTGYLVASFYDVLSTGSRAVGASSPWRPLPKVSDDHSNSISQATKVGVDSRTAGKIETTADNDFFRFEVGTAGTLTVYTTGSTDTYGYLLNSKGIELAHNDDTSATNRNFRITRSVSPGTYFARARHFSSGGTGSYTLAAEFSAANNKAQRAVLLLHGMNSAPDTWNPLVSNRWSGKCQDIYDGVVRNPISAPPRDTLGAVCYRLRFGRYDRTGLTGLEKRRCTSSSSDGTYGCKGDFTDIYSTGNDLGVEVFAAVRAILRRLGSDTQMVVLGHSRGGLAARAFLQRPASSAERNAVVGLVTTGTPHSGSPLGRIYAYLKTYCLDTNGKQINSTNRAGKPQTQWSACKDDWEAVSDLEFKVLGANLYVGKPTINLVAPNSLQIKALNAPSSLRNLPAGINVVQLRYAGQYMGHLGYIGFSPVVGLGYSVWDHGGGQGWNQFSTRSRNYALCGNATTCSKTENDPAFDGDGIVPKDWQSIPGLGTSKIISWPGGIYHKNETKQVAHIGTALGYVKWR